ncbi:MAG: NAD(P)H-binding protein [Candidatus Azobacteroides sp.]|nr:NAD(P)H-binding protein [Candidatus Azobacteroides sp.]
MNITIIGASKGVGKYTVKRALERGHQLTTLSRSGMAIKNNRLADIKGSALNLADVEKAIQGAEALVVTLGTGKDIRATTLFSDFAGILLQIHAKNPIRIPVIVLTGFGTAATLKYHPWYTKILLKVFLWRVYKNKSVMENMLSQSTLRWEFVRPWIMSNKPLTEKYRVETTDFRNVNLFGFISRYDVADFMVKQAENPTYLLQGPGLFRK